MKPVDRMNNYFHLDDLFEAIDHLEHVEIYTCAQGWKCELSTSEIITSKYTVYEGVGDDIFQAVKAATRQYKSEMDTVQ